MNESRRIALLGLLVPGAVLVLWQVVAFAKSSPLFPGPIEVTQAIIRNWHEIVSNLGVTLMRAAAGFALATVIMVPLGIFLGRVRWLGEAVSPVIDLVATLPPPAIVPLVMLFAGTGDAAKIVIITYAAGMPLIMNTYEASHTIHPMFSRVARSLHLTRFETMLLIDLPSSLPMIATGARLAVASSLLVSITSEMLLATNGIGVYLQRSQENFQIGSGLAGIAFISAVGIVINALAYRIEQKLLFWHYRR
ncbi:ABC transporter permease [Tabrizicola sp.]|uniref:ABC transporter permease n=1 Tax=Tabrizicola sp. TaxID=2005166 RepID=UPI001A5DCFB5|nr:ABC transporter permease [Tabrizicola sp.]MBL9073750.1 ABC transporter permease [Tabrizicola sp.]